MFLTIPNVFSKTGWLGGILLYTIVASLNTYTMTNILEVASVYSKKPNEKGHFREVKSYTDLAERIQGNMGKLLCIIFMFIVQFSCCVGYLVFVASILESLICS